MACRHSNNRENRARIGLSRRGFLGHTVAGAATLLSSDVVGEAFAAPKPGPLGLPGPYPGRVIEVFHPGSVVHKVVRPLAVEEMLDRGMTLLTGAPGPPDAWRRFFERGDVVGIKVCPVGRPRAVTQCETLVEIISALNGVGIPNKDILVFDRYSDYLRDAVPDYVRVLPEGVRWDAPGKAPDNWRVEKDKYDLDVYADFHRVHKGLDLSDPEARRSHLCMIVSKQINKLINTATLKDHVSAGVTICLKNLSHGLVNNVSRSHDSASEHWCDTFIPEVVALDEIRTKTVLNIVDGLIGCYEGGPGSSASKHNFTYRSMLFGTDPVATDRIGWDIIDTERARRGFPPVAQCGIMQQNRGNESFDYRQPQHIPNAARKGLGIFDRKRIQHVRVRLS